MSVNSFNELIKLHPSIEDDIEELRIAVRKKTSKAFSKVIIIEGLVISVIMYLAGVYLW